MTGIRLPRAFFTRPTQEVARGLLGKRLVRIEAGGQRLSGIVLETEGYIGAEDQGCHARSGRTQRNETMWGPPGHAYVYFTYGMHWMLNAVTEETGYPAAVLICALLPLEGLESMRERRPDKPFARWTDGPAKLCQALGINGTFNGCDLCFRDSLLFFEEAFEIPKRRIQTGPRVGLNNTPEPWKSMPWRFQVSLDSQQLISWEGKE